jgi:exodeoxyribonuclease V alpha subunit
MNRRIEDLLGASRIVRADSGFTRPILVDRNDPSLDLYNGDVGVLFRETRLASPRAMFRAADGAIRTLSPARLPPHEPAFAMSVHKSQGSEFDEVLVVLPNEASPLLSRELFYTAVTRARRRVTVHASAASIREAVRRRVVRTSGLASALRLS